MAPKMLGLVASCGTCPHYKYKSGNLHECEKVHEIVADKSVIAPFCPLADFPSRIMADQSTTIRRLRAGYTYSLVTTVLSHIATKLDTLVDNNGALPIPLKNDKIVYLRWDSFVNVDLPSWEVFFQVGDKQYRLLPDARPPELHVARTVEGYDYPLWERLELAK